MRAGIRVVIAEDDAHSAELLQFILEEDLGFSVLGSATRGDEAVELVESLRPDLVIMDMAMPRVDGVDATRLIQERCPTPVVALTAFASGDWVQRATAAGVGAYLLKPVKPEELERAVEVAMARFEDMMALRRLVGELRQAEEERRQLEARVRDAEKLESLAVLAGGVAHDFNNILMGVLGNAELALMKLPGESPARKYLDRIIEAARRAAQVSDHMLAYSGRGSFVIESVDVSALVADEAPLLEETTCKGVELELELATGLPLVNADTEQLRRLVSSLVHNAAEAVASDRGTIVISTAAVDCSREELRRAQVDDNLPAGRYVRIEVSDNGAGMSHDILSRVFDPFFSTKFTGRGLGLAMVLGIVRSHQGAVWVHSEEGEGTRVTVLLPAADQDGGTIQDADSQSPTWNGDGAVLLVDDEPMVLHVARDLLGALGLEVLTAGSGREAVELYRQHGGRILLSMLDVQMPGMDGVETCAEIRRLCPDARIVLSSGYDEAEARQRYGALDGVGFVQKPYRLVTLRDTIRDALDG